MLSLLDEQDAAILSTDPVECFFVMLNTLLSSGRAYVTTRLGAKLSQNALYALGWQTDFVKQEFVGHIDVIKGRLLLNPGLVFVAIRKLANEQGEPFPWNLETLLQRLKDRNLIEFDSDGNRPKRMVYDSASGKLNRKRVIDLAWDFTGLTDTASEHSQPSADIPALSPATPEIKDA